MNSSEIRKLLKSGERIILECKKDFLFSNPSPLKIPSSEVTKVPGKVHGKIFKNFLVNRFQNARDTCERVTAKN